MAYMNSYLFCANREVAISKAGFLSTKQKYLNTLSLLALSKIKKNQEYNSKINISSAPNSRF